MSYKLSIMVMAGALACGGGDDGPTQPSDGNGAVTVNVVNNSFDPDAVSVPVNGTVTWQWNSSGVLHNVTFQDGAPGSGNRSSGSFPRTFTAAGTYPYLCNIHPTEMTGTVTVAAGTSGGNDGGGDGGGDGYP